MLAGFTAGAIGLVTEWDNFVKGIETAFPYLFENGMEEKEKQERREREQSGENTSLSDQSGGLGSPDIIIKETNSYSTSTNPEVSTRPSDNRNFISQFLSRCCSRRTS